MATQLPDYNGWSNYFTWAVHLWITNEGSSYNYANELISKARRGIDAEDSLKEWIEESKPLVSDASMFQDILGYALAFVDWREIAEALADDSDKERWEEARK